MYLCSYACILCMYVCIYACIRFVNAHACAAYVLYVYRYTYIHIHTYMSAYMHTGENIYTCVHTLTHTYTHRYIVTKYILTIITRPLADNHLSPKIYIYIYIKSFVSRDVPQNSTARTGAPDGTCVLILYIVSGNNSS